MGQGEDDPSKSFPTELPRKLLSAETRLQRKALARGYSPLMRATVSGKHPAIKKKKSHRKADATANVLHFIAQLSRRVVQDQETSFTVI